MKDETYALELLERAVAERGDGYNYRKEFGASCRYELHGQPACIVGLVAHLDGISMVTMRTCEGRTADVVMRAFGFTRRAGDLLFIAQQVQDRGGTWGDALIEAKSAFVTSESRYLYGGKMS